MAPCLRPDPLPTVLPSVFQGVVILAEGLQGVQSFALALPVGVRNVVYGKYAPAVGRGLDTPPIPFQHQRSYLFPLGRPHIGVVVPTPTLPPLSYRLQLPAPLQPLAPTEWRPTHLAGQGESDSDADPYHVRRHVPPALTALPLDGLTGDPYA